MIPYVKAKSIQFKEVGGGGGSSPTPQGMRIGHPADKTTFKVGEVFDITGLILFEEFTDDFLKDVTLLATSSIPVGSTFTETYSGNVTFTYDGYSVSYAIEVASALPEGYTELTALHHYNYQPLNLGVMAGNVDGGYVSLEYDVKIDSQNGSGWGTIIGYFDSYNASFALCRQGQDTRVTLRYYFGGINTIYQWIDESMKDRHKFLFDSKNGKIYVDGKEYALTGVSQFIRTNVWLCPQVGNDSSDYVVGDFYEVRTINTDTNEVLHNFIPCKNPSNQIGFYDTVGKTFVSANTSSWSAVE